MQRSQIKLGLFVKALVATVALAALAGVAGAQLAPSVPLSTVLLYSALGGAALFAVAIVAVLAKLTWGQFILRKGGTDPQWFWFSAEPPGLVEMREKIAAQAHPPKT
jgi:hypothetical protein